MNLTRHARSLLADPRRELATVLTVMALVLALVGVHVLCSVHLDEAAHGASHSHGAGHSHEASAQSSEDHSETAKATFVEIADAPLGDDQHCADHGSVAAQCDPVLPVPQVPAVVPDLAVQWLVPDMPRHEARAPAAVVAVAAPSLHALGISRT